MRPVHTLHCLNTKKKKKKKKKKRREKKKKKKKKKKEEGEEEELVCRAVAMWSLYSVVHSVTRLRAGHLNNRRSNLGKDKEFGPLLLQNVQLLWTPYRLPSITYR